MEYTLTDGGIRFLNSTMFYLQISRFIEFYIYRLDINKILFKVAYNRYSSIFAKVDASKRLF